PPAEDGRLTPETAWVEDDPVRPLNVYGASKAAGEQAVRLADRRHLIVRVSSLFGVVPPRNKGDNFIEAILKKARAGGALRVVSDQWITPTYTVDAAGAIVRLALDDVGGVAHVASSDGCTWHVLATEALRLVGLATTVEAVPASTYYSKAPRVRNGALHTDRLTSLLGAPPPSWREALWAYLIAKGHVSFTRVGNAKRGTPGGFPPCREPCQAMTSGSPRSPFPGMVTAAFPSSGPANCFPQATLPHTPSQVRVVRSGVTSGESNSRSPRLVQRLEQRLQRLYDRAQYVVVLADTSLERRELG